MFKKKIALICANKLRDLDGLIYLKFKLEKKGYIVQIFNFASHSNFVDIFYFAPHILVIPTILEKSMREFSKFLKNYGTKIIELKSEGLFSERDEEEGYNKFEDSSFLDGEIAWGTRMKSGLLKNSNLQEKKIFICGHPRFDIYTKKRFHLSKENFCKKYDLNKKNKIISCATGFAPADFTKKQIKKAYNKSNSNLYLITKKYKILRAKFFYSITKLAKEFPKIIFIIKIHPYESSKFYIQNKPKDTKNLIILKKEKIGNIISFTDIFIHTNSTSSVEAWLHNLYMPTISFYPDVSKKMLIESIGGGDFIENYECLKERVMHYLTGNLISEVKLNFRKNFIKKNFYKIDGKSSERAANVIDKIAITARLNSKKLKIPFFIHFLKFKLLIRKVLKIPEDRSLLFLKKHKDYWDRIATNKEILDREELLGKIS